MDLEHVSYTMTHGVVMREMGIFFPAAFVHEKKRIFSLLQLRGDMILQAGERVGSLIRKFQLCILPLF